MNLRQIRIAAIALAFAATLATAITGFTLLRAAEGVHPAKPLGPVALYTFDGARIVKR
jgi:hypothetical protein